MSRPEPLSSLLEEVQTGFACGDSDNDGVAQIRMNNVDVDGRLRLDSVRRVPKHFKDLAKFGLVDGDILFNNTNSPELVGKTALFTGAQEPFVFSNHFTRLRVNRKRVDPRYVARWLAKERNRGVFSRLCNQWVNQASVRKEALLALEVPLPETLKEQRRIADILDKADAIRRKRKEAIALTEELLRSAFLDMFGDPVTNPKGWPVKALGELVEIRGGGTPSRARADFFAGNIPWATAKDFRSDVLTDTEEHVSEAALAESASKLVPRGSILIVVKSKILMRRLPVAVAGVPLCFNQDVKALILREVHDGPYLATHIRLAQRQLLELARGVNTEGLTLAHLRGHMVMLPPVSVVRAFAALETKVRSSLTKAIAGTDAADDLFNSLVARAFSGALEPSR